MEVNPFALYIYTYEIAKPLRLLYTYTYTEFVIEIWGFNQRLTDTSRYHQNEAPMCSILLAAITSVCLLVGGKVCEVRRGFSRVLEPTSVSNMAVLLNDWRRYYGNNFAEWTRNSLDQGDVAAGDGCWPTRNCYLY